MEELQKILNNTLSQLQGMMNGIELRVDQGLKDVNDPEKAKVLKDALAKAKTGQIDQDYINQLLKKMEINGDMADKLKDFANKTDDLKRN